jgi:hypothetical protein
MDTHEKTLRFQASTDERAIVNRTHEAAVALRVGRRMRLRHQQPHPGTTRRAAARLRTPRPTASRPHVSPPTVVACADHPGAGTDFADRDGPYAD